MNEPSLSVRDQLRNRLSGLRTRLGKFIPFFSGVLGALLALYIYNALSPETQLTRTDVDDAVASALASATPRPPNSVAVYQIIQPSLVLIETEGEDANGEFGQSLGSGVIINERGEILTSLHVVDGASRISVTFADGTKAEGAIINAQPEIDIAMLATSVLPELYLPATIGNAGAMQVGDEAYVVGNPFGLYGSMSSGVISGFDRVYRPPELPNVIRGLIQVDAAINPGNSGGPLLNRSGHVVGIVTGIINPTEDSFFIGIGFAVPISVAAGGAGGMPPY
ncbi:MAG TPA: trypsin-like peptidase domain-containing protein [Anaerolineales bacterium]|nr:trypsin-like peptidase domain-containing protein [Anaerolineales bacterium]